MSDEHDPLFEEIGNIMEGAQDAVDMEKMSRSLLNISYSLVVFRKFMVESGFSEQWVEDACMVLWRKWFPTTATEEE